ncbi:50S ribosomal protein L29 [candidate division Kazan bacterium RBG_13_50_9]|uniref:Large ribosomal subunit protein uL29 n=1 Tax=candidate division Kazan bacterium RBG_13_50_9 TaxID=1798535 RepID=A0A1F4NSM0_UNCK3|nr:MAG: 50S ribosomal protein L29 [candidate division Kazan bacterium RBG_13_50_9]
MKLDKARQLSPADLGKEITKVRQQLVQLRSEVAMHKAKNLKALKSARRYLARLLTVRREKELISIEKA